MLISTVTIGQASNIEIQVTRSFISLCRGVMGFIGNHTIPPTPNTPVLLRRKISVSVQRPVWYLNIKQFPVPSVAPLHSSVGCWPMNS